MRTLSQEETRELFSLKREQINSKLLKDYFAIKGDSLEPRFNTFDKIILPKGKWYNKEEIETTIGRYIFNFFVFPETFLKYEGYQNIEIKKDTLEKIEEKMGVLLLNDLLPIKEYTEYLNNGE